MRVCRALLCSAKLALRLGVTIATEQKTLGRCGAAVTGRDQLITVRDRQTICGLRVQRRILHRADRDYLELYASSPAERPTRLQPQRLEHTARPGVIRPTISLRRVRPNDWIVITALGNLRAWSSLNIPNDLL
jgi:hypothetical protein